MDLSEANNESTIHNLPNNGIQPTQEMTDQPVRPDTEDRLSFPSDIIDEEGSSSKSDLPMPSMLDVSYNQQLENGHSVACSDSQPVIPLNPSESTDVVSESTDVVSKSPDILENSLHSETENTEELKNEKMVVDDSNISSDCNKSEDSDMQTSNVCEIELDKKIEPMSIDEEGAANTELEESISNVDENETTECTSREATVEDDAKMSTTEAIDGVETNINVVESNTDSVESNTDGDESNTDRVESNTDGVESNTDGVEFKTDPVESNTDPVESNTDRIESNTGGVDSNTDHVESNTGGVESNRDGVESNIDKEENLKKDYTEASNLIPAVSGTEVEETEPMQTDVSLLTENKTDNSDSQSDSEKVSCEDEKCTNTSDPSENLEDNLTKSSTAENTEVNFNEVHSTDSTNDSINNENSAKATEELADKCHDSVQMVEDQLETECGTKERNLTGETIEKKRKETTDQVTESTIPTSTSSTPTLNNIDQTNSEDTNNSNPVFVHVSSESEKSNVGKNVLGRSLTDNQEEEDFQVSQPQEDPIASDNFTSTTMEEDAEEVDQNADEQMDEEQGASEEMCIIPDTERVISQAEKDAAVSMVPLRDPADSEFFPNDPSADGQSGEMPIDKRNICNPENYVVSLCIDENVNSCMQCCLPRKSKYSILHKKVTSYVCDDGCLNNFKRRHSDKIIMNNEGDLRVKKLASGINNDNMIAKVKFPRKCVQCLNKLTLVEAHLSWETMEFCNETCLSRYQKAHVPNCAHCNETVRDNCLGKYGVRFGYNLRQFCSTGCLDEYKKGVKVCSYCQKDMSSGVDGFLAPVGDKGQFKDFCSKLCMEKYDVMSNNRGQQVQKSGIVCSVCLNEKPITIEYEHDNKMNLFCGEPCFVAFKFVNNITPGQCCMCKKYFDTKILEANSMYHINSLFSFCSLGCQNIHIIRQRKLVACTWCKVKKYNFDMIQEISNKGATLPMCSLNCLGLYRVSVNAVQAKKTNCDHCQKTLQPLYHLTMSDATMRNFCSYPCVMAFQSQFPKTPITLNEPEETGVPVPTGGPKKLKRRAPKRPKPVPADVPTIPVISSVQSLATTNGPSSSTLRTPRSNNSVNSSQSPSPPIVKTRIKKYIIIKPAPIPPQRNVGTMCKLNMKTKGVSCKPTTCDAEVQTDEVKEKTAIVPIPVPIYVPAPMWMYSMPFPVPFPFPLPVPVPIFIPTTRNSANGIMKEIKKIQVKIPTDPFEAELLMMAEMVAGDKKDEHTDSESEEEDTAPPPEEATFSPEPVDASNTFGDDMLQMALKMATELDEPAVDLEGALTANTITASQTNESAVAVEESTEESQPIHHIMERQSIRGRKRPGRPPKTSVSTSKRGRRSSSQMDIPIMPPPQPPPPQEPVEKPDANMCLKYTFGVNAWKQWVTTKNAELEKTSRRVKLFKPEILQLTADELNYSLCLFVKEVRKPNGQEYAPDTIYYLCLGIQQYLFENARIDNIFCDSYYEKFTDCLDEVAKKFSVLYNDSHYIVTRVEEEHLWESKQLGAHSPHVLLSTLMFFNTKHFNLTTVDEHMQLSFSHIMKHWKRNPNQPGTTKVAGSRNVLLRFYPPQTNNTDTTQRKKKVYEQQENEDNPLRCPVKLYEFYLSKCPESVKTRNDVFYLLPERSCVPDSPVWYSTMPLPKAALEKMLHRVKMVKEINVALLTS